MLLTTSILILTFSVSQIFFNSAFVEYKTASYQANYTKALYLAQSGLEAGIFFIKELEQYGFFNKTDIPYPVPFGENLIQFQAEDLNGKLNVNQLYNLNYDTINERQRLRFSRLSEFLKLSPDIWDGVIDWIDTNNIPEPYGYERSHYGSLHPPRKIRNGFISSLEELLLIPGFTRAILFSDLRTEDEKEDIADFFSLDEEDNLISDKDFIFANNITYALPSDPLNTSIAERININSAPYLVLLSLHEKMTPEIARAILRKRERKGKLDKNDLKEIGVPEAMTDGSATDGGAFNIGYKGAFYKIKASATVKSQTAHVTVTYDKNTNDIIDYAE